MKPLTLTLRNFRGIRDGMRRDEVMLDLQRYRGLVALVGPNGGGKTTVLDNLHPYRLMPFRAGGYSPRQFSYYEETIGEALKDFVWEHNGQTYRSEIIIKGANKTKKTEAYIYLKTPDGWMPASASDGTVSDGKTDTYDTCVNAILGTPEMFFTAIYAAQGRKSLADYKAGDIKLLLSELLGLDSLLQYSKEAEDAAKHQAARLEGMRHAVAEYESAKGELELASANVTRWRAQLEAAQTEQPTARERATKAQSALADARAKASLRDETIRRQNFLDQQLGALEREAHTARLRVEDQIAAAKRDGDGADIRDDIKRAEEKVAEITGRIESSRRQLDNLPDPVAAAAAVAQLESELAEHDRKLTMARAYADALSGASSNLSTLVERRTNIGTTGRSNAQSLKEHQDRSALTGRVPCAGLPINSECELLRDARESAVRAETLSVDIEKLRAQHEELTTKIVAARAEVEKHNEALQTVRDLESERTTIDGNLTAARNTHRESGVAEQIRAAIAQASSDIEQQRALISDKQAALLNRATAVEQQIEAIRSTAILDSQGRADRERLLRVEKEALPDPGKPDDFTQAETELRRADAALADVDARLTEAKTKLSGLEVELRTLRNKVAAGEAGAKEASQLADDIAAWRLLSKALGRDGIVALSIDDAGPSLSSTANDLLTACYGPRFSIRFDTQTVKADGTMREDFDIRVFDSESDDDKSVLKTSGGERIWINEALTRAIALFRAQQTGQQYQTLFSDESDGALDPERKQHYMRMKRRVLELGGYEAEFFISHTPELQQQADDVINIGAMRISA